MRLGTRASPLARAQARQIADLLAARGIDVELVPVTTRGDRGAPAGDKSRWVKELELALLAGEIDVAVHSAKDVPAELPDGLALAAVPARADARDALCGATALERLPAGATVGTSSLRRAAALRALRPDLEVVALRGNVDTRLGKLARGDADALVLAVAGLERLGRADAIGAVLDELVPAPGQGALALETRADDAATRAALAAIDDPDAAACLAAERAVVRAVGATCHAPLGAHARPTGDGRLRVRTFVGLPDGSAWLRDELVSRPGEAPEAVGAAAGERLLAAGGRDLLAAAEAAGANRPPPASTPEGTRL